MEAVLKSHMALLVIAVWGLSATSLEAQDRSKPARIGVLMGGTEASSRAVLNPDDKRMAAELREAERASKANSIVIHPLVVTKPEDIEPAFSKAAAFGGVVVVFDAMTFFHRTKLADIAIRNRVATIFNFRQYVDAGGLLSFGPNLRDMWRQSARHIQKILKGETPGEIPMEQPTRFELVINLKAAKALGLEVPPTLLARADEVIE